jgi:hypothetical protein
MRRWLAIPVVLVLIGVAYVVAHLALIETGQEVIVLRTEEPGGAWLETRLWIVDDAGASWLHGNRGSEWMQNLEERPVVEVIRGGERRRYRATLVPGPHPRLHELLRAKYGLADRWVRFVGPDGESTTPVRLDPISEP